MKLAVNIRVYTRNGGSLIGPIRGNSWRLLVSLSLRLRAQCHAAGQRTWISWKVYRYTLTFLVLPIDRLLMNRSMDPERSLTPWIQVCVHQKQLAREQLDRMVRKRNCRTIEIARVTRTDVENRVFCRRRIADATNARRSSPRAHRDSRIV